MNFYEQTKNKSIEEMAEFLVGIYLAGYCSFFNFTPNENFIKTLPNYEDFYNSVKSKLMEEIK